MNQRMTFYKWLMEQVGRDDPIGDFASDAESDSSSPGRSAGREEWLGYLRWTGRACPEAIEAFKAAWVEYSATAHG